MVPNTSSNYGSLCQLNVERAPPTIYCLDALDVANMRLKENIDYAKKMKVYAEEISP